MRGSEGTVSGSYVSLHLRRDNPRVQIAVERRSALGTKLSGSGEDYRREEEIGVSERPPGSLEDCEVSGRAVDHSRPAEQHVARLTLDRLCDCERGAVNSLGEHRMLRGDETEIGEERHDTPLIDCYVHVLYRQADGGGRDTFSQRHSR